MGGISQISLGAPPAGHANLADNKLQEVDNPAKAWGRTLGQTRHGKSCLCIEGCSKPVGKAPYGELGDVKKLDWI